jgi:hypothetical protein
VVNGMPPGPINRQRDPGIQVRISLLPSTVWPPAAFGNVSYLPLDEITKVPIVPNTNLLFNHKDHGIPKRHPNSYTIKARATHILTSEECTAV